MIDIILYYNINEKKLPLIYIKITIVNLCNRILNISDYSLLRKTIKKKKTHKKTKHNKILNF